MGIDSFLKCIMSDSLTSLHAKASRARNAQRTTFDGHNARRKEMNRACYVKNLKKQTHAG